MPAPKHHIERLREQLRLEIGTVIATEMRDPRIPPIVTVTEVKLAQDTRDATVFVSFLGDEQEKADALAALASGAGFIQRLLGSRVTMKNLPRLHFKLDRSIEKGQHINRLLDEIRDDLE